MKLSTFIGKPVISPNGDAYGYVTDVRLGRTYDTVSCIVCVDDEEEEFYLPLRAVHAVADAVVAGKARNTAPTGVPSPVGNAVYTDRGEALGTVADVIIGETEEAMLVIASGDARSQTPVSRASIGETVVLYPDAERKRRAAKKMTASHRPSSNGHGVRQNAPESPAGPAAKFADGEDNSQEANAVQDSAVQNESTVQNASIVQDGAAIQDASAAVLLNRTNLLGRHVRRNVYDASGAPIAAAGECITPEVLSRARRAGKLLQLTVNTLTVL